MIGAGTSTLSEDMFTAGYTAIWNTDIPQTAVQRMLARWERLGLPQDRWVELDARNMSAYFGESSFDATLEKGVMDAVLSGPGYNENLNAMLDEVELLLLPGG